MKTKLFQSSCHKNTSPVLILSTTTSTMMMMMMMLMLFLSFFGSSPVIKPCDALLSSLTKHVVSSLVDTTTHTTIMKLQYSNESSSSSSRMYKSSPLSPSSFPLHYRSLNHQGDGGDDDSKRNDSNTITFSLPQIPLTFVLESPTTTTTTGTVQKQSQMIQTQNVVNTAAAAAATTHQQQQQQQQQQGHVINHASMDQYLDSIDKRYRRLYDYNKGYALVTLFTTSMTTSSSSSSSTFPYWKRNRQNKLRVFIAFVFHHCCRMPSSSSS